MEKILLQPSRCTSKLPAELDKAHLVGEEKLDGSRYMLYVGYDPYDRNLSKHTFLSRRLSSVDNMNVDRSKQLYHITRLDFEGLEGTVLDGEVMGNDFLSTNSILNSNPKLALQKQKENGFLTFHVFDVPVFRGKDIRGLPLKERRKVLEEVVRRMDCEHIKCIPQFEVDLEGEFTRIVSEGGEGIIVKDNRQGYGQGWSKMKKSYDVSTVITGFKPGNGKYEGQIGALAVSVYHDGDLVEIGFASGFDDALRKEMTDNFSRYEGMVVDVFTQEIQKSKRSEGNPVGRLRHPTFHRLRDDLEPNTITSEKLKEDMKASKTRSSRFKGRS